ncbi:hypothetical protein [Tuwongella immobilis]|uniref:Uncharacterized protein n=1 Tax=Tuwongella immobilis TaxID=692036 RepID=A0A6C2YVY3_9BACT|nr:hypothetical protein [Tuwongella immobilis]VIP05527.1 Putative uncharacterized protein OS=uncultured bacterium RM57 PE=4 SV=1 [Tuwongella immobilis]VTS08410.1 Putative uncharacterized protein OS=uncultured bacterium RM57 PE=4 SV=1 [Tuwongella immobilis]
MTRWNWIAATYRLHPEVEIRRIPDLSPIERDRLGKGLDPEIHAVIWPKLGVLRSVKAICGRTLAILDWALSANRLPPESAALLSVAQGQPLEQWLQRLVIAEILEVESQGRWSSGPSVAAWAESPLGTDSLSAQALRYAACLPVSDPHELSARLYFFQRRPVSPTLEAKWPHLPLQTPQWLSDRIPADWSAVPIRREDGWQHLLPPRPGPKPRHTTWKLYVSTTPEQLIAHLPAMLQTLAEQPLTAAKIVCTAAGLQRPDHFVAYFAEQAELRDAAKRLRIRFDGLPGTGIPFTASAGVPWLGWGVDPPRLRPRTDQHEPESWRLWLTNRLALAIVQAKSRQDAAQSPQSAVDFALLRIRAEGVDPQLWLPLAEWMENHA